MESMTLRSDAQEQQMFSTANNGDSSFLNFGTPLDFSGQDSNFLDFDPSPEDTSVFDLLGDLETPTPKPPQNAVVGSFNQSGFSTTDPSRMSDAAPNTCYSQYTHAPPFAQGIPFSGQATAYSQQQGAQPVFQFQAHPQVAAQPQYQTNFNSCNSLSSLQLTSSNSSVASSPSSLDLEHTAPPVADPTTHARKRRALRRKKLQTKQAQLPTITNSDSEDDSDKGKRGKKRKREDMTDHEWQSRQAERRKKNRVSAQQSRERHKVYVSNLESHVDELSTKNTALTAKVASLENQNAIMRERLIELEKKNGTTSTSVPPPAPPSATPIFLPGLLWHLWSSTGPQSGRKRTSTGRTATVLLVAVLAFALFISTGHWPLARQASFEASPEHMRFNSRSLLSTDNLTGKMKLDHDAASVILDSMPDNLNFTVDQKAAQAFFSQIMSSFGQETEQTTAWFTDFNSPDVSVKDIFSSLLKQLEGKTTRIDDRALKERVLYCLHQTVDNIQSSPSPEPPSVSVKAEDLVPF